MRGMSPFSLYAIPAAVISVGAMLYFARAWKYRWDSPRLTRQPVRLVNGVEAQEVQCDELWSFVGMKERQRQRGRLSPLSASCASSLPPTRLHRTSS